MEIYRTLDENPTEKRMLCGNELAGVEAPTGNEAAKRASPANNSSTFKAFQISTGCSYGSTIPRQQQHKRKLKRLQMRRYRKRCRARGKYDVPQAVKVLLEVQRLEATGACA